MANTERSYKIERGIKNGKLYLLMFSLSLFYDIGSNYKKRNLIRVVIITMEMIHTGKKESSEDDDTKWVAIKGSIN